MRIRAPSGRRVCVLALCCVAAGLAIAGCGDGDGGDGKVSPELAAVLAYLPPDPAFAGIIPTDLDRAPVKRLEERASKLEGWSDVKKELERQIAEDADFDRDVRPQLGNPIVFSAATVDQSDDADYSAVKVKDPHALRRLTERSIAKGREKRLGEYKGALITRDVHRSPGEEPGNDFTALHRDVMIQANSREALEKAIDRSAGSDNLAGNEKVASALDGIAADVLFHADRKSVV